MRVLDRAGDRCVMEAHAKVNLSLRVLAREDTGFHQIETLFCTTDLADEVEVALAPPRADGDVTLAVAWNSALQPAPQDLGPAAQNLAVRAVRAFMSASRLEAAVDLVLRKRIPAGAGLGGGSADAAAVLRAMNLLHGGLSEDALLDLGATLGVDVPFLLSGLPLALAWGRGTRMLPLPPPPRAFAVFLQPAATVSTAAAYAALAARRAAGSVPLPPLVHRGAADWDGIAAESANDFEAVVFEGTPAVAAAWQQLKRREPVLVRMSGSGSCVFGVFRERAAAEEAAAAIPGEVDGVRAIVAGLPAPQG